MNTALELIYLKATAIKGYVKVTKSGKIVTVKEHQDNRPDRKILNGIKSEDNKQLVSETGDKLQKLSKKDWEGNCRNACAVASKLALGKGIKDFKIEHGSVHIYGEEIDHYWLKTDDGKIIDPSVSQFAGQKIVYEKKGILSPASEAKNVGKFTIESSSPTLESIYLKAGAPMGNQNATRHGSGISRFRSMQTSKQTNTPEELKARNLHQMWNKSWRKTGMKQSFHDFVKQQDPSNAKSVIEYDLRGKNVTASSVIWRRQ